MVPLPASESGEKKQAERAKKIKSGKLKNNL
jgi:hypothetical protein